MIHRPPFQTGLIDATPIQSVILLKAELCMDLGGIMYKGGLKMIVFVT